MKKRILIIVTIVIIALLVCLLIWCLWPHSFSDAMHVDEDSVISFSAGAMVSRIENGQPCSDAYRIDVHQMPSGSLGEILEILNASGYRQDFRNLLPWGVDYVDADKNYDGHTVTLLFVYGNEKDDYISIQLLSSSILAVYTEEAGFRIYHPTNHNVIYNLAEYLQTHGTKQ